MNGKGNITQRQRIATIFSVRTKKILGVNRSGEPITIQIGRPFQPLNSDRPECTVMFGRGRIGYLTEAQVDQFGKALYDWKQMVRRGEIEKPHEHNNRDNGV